MMKLDHNIFWDIEIAIVHNRRHCQRAKQVKFKTTNRDGISQEYTVRKDDGECGAKWIVGLTWMFYMITAEQCDIVGPARFVSFLKCLGQQALNIWVAVIQLADYHSDTKRTTENFLKAWNKFFEMLYNCKNVRDVQILGFKLRWFKKPLMMCPFDFERRWNDCWNKSMTLSPRHRPIPGTLMKLPYFFLSYAKADHLAFHQANNL